MMGSSGVIECLVIPIGANPLIRGKKGIYTDMVAYELIEKKPIERILSWLSKAYQKRYSMQ